ncbi:hypothetical protein GTS_27090 [Gandjariella thermophila]|uniref:Uncharacterized protein n=1 Tax=Gandjariella thermophila TaxID=1931992 RepID=A0A4D4J9A5_9PSEU|nr:hypothetical protein GTS_27090 [Gandjariella thermophila]
MASARSIAATMLSYWSSDAKIDGGPAEGQRDHSTCRQLRYRVSSPLSYGEFAVNASSTGSQGRTWLLTAVAVSRSSTPTCTWQPQVVPVLVMAPKCFAILR